MYRILCSAMGYDGGKSGVSEYINQTVAQLSQGHCVELVILSKDIASFPLAESENLKFIRCANFLRFPLVNMLWHLFVLPIYIDFKRYDFVFLPAGNRRLFIRCPIPVVVTFHDLSQFHIEAKYDWLRMLYIRKVVPYFLKKVDVIMAISENTREDLVRYYGIDKARIQINYNGCKKLVVGDLEKKNERRDPLVKGAYILYVARLEHPGKNHLNLIKAYEELSPELKDQYQLVLAGSDWNGAEIIHQYVHVSKDCDRITFLGYVADEDLPALYKGASLYAFPSYYEGFGLPLLEAMASRVPIVCADASSLPEIGGDAVLLFDPKEPESIAEAIRKVLCDSLLAEDLVGKGLSRVKLFTWEKHAAKIVGLYEDLVCQRGKPEVMGIHFDNVKMAGAVAKIDAAVAHRDKSRFFFLNADCVNKAYGDSNYASALKNCEGLFPDGIGVRLAAKFFGISLKDNVNGTDLLPKLCESAIENNNSIFLLGGEEGVAQRMKQHLELCYEGLRIVGSHHGFFDSGRQSADVISKINQSQADILLVAFGAPLQEMWISDHFSEINCYAMLGVGGLFDFYSQDKKRAPKYLRERGLEWCYRLYKEPQRLAARYLLGNPLFLWHALMWKLWHWHTYSKGIKGNSQSGKLE